VLKATNPELEIVQYEQGGHHLHRMISLAERFSRDLEDFAIRVDNGISSAGRATTQTTPQRPLEYGKRYA
jgi:hypothetical protein